MSFFVCVQVPWVLNRITVKWILVSSAIKVDYSFCVLKWFVSLSVCSLVLFCYFRFVSKSVLVVIWMVRYLATA
jgi:hypothetical protein